MDPIGKLLVGFYAFSRHAIGIVTRPYETSRRIADRANWMELVPLAGILCGYFALASLVRTSTFRPYLLTRQFFALLLGAICVYGVTVVSLYLAGTVCKGTGTMRRVAISWAYTLIPTVLWFLTTSLLFVILPPPRTTSVQGILFSVLYLVFSTTLLFWKIILAYLAVRFSMKLDLIRIIGVVCLSSPFIVGASYVLYRMGIFRVPFL